MARAKPIHLICMMLDSGNGESMRHSLHYILNNMSFGVHRYIQAAASPKDIVILLDTSGSMTGLRKSIAVNVVYSILDTLNEDDYVIVMTVSLNET